MGKKMTLTQIKKELSKRTSVELVDIIYELCKSSKETAEQVNIFLGNDSFIDEALDEAKEKIRKQFFSKRGFRMPDLRTAKSVIAAFKKICNDPQKIIDLQMHYVECGIEFTNEYGDINESFYDSIDGMYARVIETLIKPENSSLVPGFTPRLKKAVSDTKEIGWGFHDSLYDSFMQIEQL